MVQTQSKLWGGILALLGSVLFSTKAIFVKLAYQYDVDAVSLLMLRMAFSLPFFIVIGIIALRQMYPGGERPSFSLWKIALLGMTGYYVASYFDLEGLRFIDASLERIILFTYPTIVVLMNLFIYKERLSFIQSTAILIAYVGIVISFWGNLNVTDQELTIKGGVLVFISSIAYSAYLVGTGQVAPKVGSRIYNSIAMTFAALAIITHNFILHGFNLFDFHPAVYTYALLISIVSTVLPSYIIVEGIRIIGANNSSIIGSVGPISTITLAVIFLGEQINPTQALGSVIVILGVLLILLRKA